MVEQLKKKNAKNLPFNYHKILRTELLKMLDVMPWAPNRPRVFVKNAGYWAQL